MSAIVSKETLPRTADVVIIGGGVNGASTAFQLAKRGAGKVVLVERRQLGAGASGKSGALVRTHYTNPHEARLAQESLQIFRHWDDAVGAGSPGFEATGFLQIVSPDDEANLRVNVTAMQELGIETSIVSAAELAEIEPLLRTDDLTYAAFEPNTGYADPNATLYGFAEAAANHGVAIHTNTEATAILRDGNGISGVETTAGTISTRTVLLAGGAWADRLLRPLDLDFGLIPIRVQVVVFRWPPAMDPRRRHRVVIDATQHSWFRVEGAASTLIGVETGTDRRADPEIYRESIDPDFIPAARAALATRMPVFAQATMRGGWCGMIMDSPDDRPIIDQVPSVPGLFVMAGDSGTSFKTSPAIGICLAEWIIDSAPKLADLTPFRSTRFAEGRPWKDDHAYHSDRELTISR